MTPEYLRSIQRLKLDTLSFYNDRYMVDVREGHHNIRLGDLLFVSRDPVEKNWGWDNYIKIDDEIFMCQLVSVYEVVYKWLGDITHEEVKAADYSNTLSFYFRMKRFYPTLDESSEITIIKFNIQ